MPNTGKPSRDCHLCRQRRVKCDLARPACQRCIKYGTECPGYRDQQELVFRNAYPTSIKRRKNRQQQPAPSHESSPSPSQPDISTPALHPDGDFVFTSSTDVILANGANRNVNLPLTRPVYEHWTTHSVPIILNVYGNLDFIKNIYRDSSANGPLVWAAHLFSRTYVTNLRYSSATNRDSSLETQHELSTYLGKTLSSVSAALKTPDGTTRDDVLATVWILSNYELLVGSLTRTEPMSPWHLHARGLYSILKSRGSAPLYTATGRTAFWPAYNMIQIQALVNSTECPAESEEWFNIIEDTLYPGEGLTLYISIFISKITSILSRILNLLRRRDFPAASREYPMLFTQLTEADQNLNDWIATHHVIEHTLDVYMLNLRCSALIKGYHMMQLLINFLTYYPPCPTSLEQLRADRAYCLQTVQIAAKTILESVPYALGPLTKDKDKSPRALFDALKLIWPLISVFIITSTRPEQKLAAEGILSYIGREMGVRQALKTYEGRVLLPPEAQEPLGEKVSYSESDCWH